MSYLQSFQVFPNIPKQLSFLEELARNYWWCWRLDAVELFRRIDAKLWQESKRNPIAFSTLISQERLEKLAHDDSFLAHQQRVKELFEREVKAPVDRSVSVFEEESPIAYFSMEFGIHESLPLFAGGLGILAGDHLKASSDMAIPLVGVGILYQNGYFHQYLNQEGWQQEGYLQTNLYHLPVERAKDPSGNEVHISVPGPDGEIHAMVWKIMVGRIPLYLLDTNIIENPQTIREISSTLYSGGLKIRLAQEVLLGIGGIRALKSMGINPAVCHMNEGHCSLSVVERIAQTMLTHNVDLKTAIAIITRSTVFTTHTPVAAGHDEFPVELVTPYLEPFQERLETSVDEILSWGQPYGSGTNEPFSMTILGLRMAQYCNGVSELHGKVARKMWTHLWPGVPVDEIPISHITNGVHIPSWISIENSLLFDRYLGPDWYKPTRDTEVTKGIRNIYNVELWRAHELARARLVRNCRNFMIKQYEKRNAPKSMMSEVGNVLDQNVLTIAFARRFAEYKRANLLLHDPDRLEAILNSKEYPVQLIFAGKAHPQNDAGKNLIKNLIQFARRPSVRNKIIFIEDYNIDIARCIVQGADVWLNTPRRPYEACGTSGIKAAVNGILNFSILDGWWCEGYSKERGFSIGNGEEYKDHEYQDAVESHALYNILENDLIPCFYERGDGDIPFRWVEMMKASIEMGMQSFCAHRMIENYEKNFYLPAAKQFKSLIAKDAAKARNLSTQHERLSTKWRDIWVGQPVRDAEGPFRVGDTFNITVMVCLGELGTKEVEVELYYGTMKSIDELAVSYTEKMLVQEDRGKGQYLYTCKIKCRASGRYGFTVRVTPQGDEMIKSVPGLITWTEQAN